MNQLREYACVIDNSLTPNCPDLGINQTNATLEVANEDTCTPHYAWFGISCAIVVVSTLVPAKSWAIGEREASYNEGKPAWHFCGYLCIGIFQLSHMWDLVNLCRGLVDDSGDHEDSKKNQTLLRNLFTATTESLPQLFFQAYVLFSLGGYGQATKVASICISITALSLSVVSVATVARGKLSVSNKAKVVGFLFCVTDAAVRSMGFAMAFSADVRSYGMPIAAVTFVLSIVLPCFLTCRKKRPDRSVVCTFPYLLPIVILLWPSERIRRSGVEPVLALRFLENIIFGILAAAFGQTACGDSLERELLVLHLGHYLFVVYAQNMHVQASS